MPTRAHSELPRPKSWDEFEDIVWDIYTRLWNDPHADRYGRNGQPQHGVDIVGRPKYLDRRLAGVQCKRYAVGSLTRRIIKAEVLKAEKFRGPLAEYTIATTEARDENLQSFVLQLCEERMAQGRFPVYLDFWESIWGRLTDYPKLLRKHYGDWHISDLQCESDDLEKTFSQLSKQEWEVLQALALAVSRSVTGDASADELASELRVLPQVVIRQIERLVSKDLVKSRYRVVDGFRDYGHCSLAALGRRLYEQFETES